MFSIDVDCPKKSECMRREGIVECNRRGYKTWDLDLMRMDNTLERPQLDHAKYI